MTRPPRNDRRTFLKRTAGVSAASLSALGGCLNFSLPKSPASGAFKHRKYTLGAKASGWEGIAPELIRDERNPELSMEPGKTIEITWTNLDGKPHKLIIEDSLGNTLRQSPTISRRGKTHTVTFRAKQRMTTYRCQYHPVQMYGEMLVTQY